jgi:hypothetical protein
VIILKKAETNLTKSLKMDGAVTNAFPNLDFSDCSPAFKNELLFYVRKRDMIGPDFNCTAMMVPVGDAVTNDRDALMYKALNVSAPFPKNRVQDGETNKKSTGVCWFKVDAFVAVFDTTDGLIRSTVCAFLHSYRITLTTDVSQAMYVYKTFKNWRIPYKL